MIRQSSGMIRCALVGLGVPFIACRAYLNLAGNAAPGALWNWLPSRLQSLVLHHCTVPTASGCETCLGLSTSAEVL